MKEEYLSHLDGPAEPIGLAMDANGNIIKQPRKSQVERNESLFREGWKLELAASLFTNDDKTEVAVVFSDGRYFRGALVDEQN